MERRFKKAINDGGIVAWADVFDESQEMPGRQTKYQHILDRTFKRPRDVIKFCNEVLVAYKANVPIDPTSKFRNEDIIAARSNYSDYMLKELEDEIHKHHPRYEDYIELLRVIGKGAFTRDEFDGACKARVDLTTSSHRTHDILRHLFEFSLIAYQRTGGIGGGSEYVWRYLDSAARFDEAAVYFRVHPGLLEAIGLKKFTYKRESNPESSTI